MNLRRGEVWDYNPVVRREGRSTLRLVISSDAYNDDSRTPDVYAAQIADDDPGRLLAVRIGDHGWARFDAIERALKSRLTAKLGEATPEEMDAAVFSLRAVFDI